MVKSSSDDSGMCTVYACHAYACDCCRHCTFANYMFGDHQALQVDAELCAWRICCGGCMHNSMDRSVPPLVSDASVDSGKRLPFSSAGGHEFSSHES